MSDSPQLLPSQFKMPPDPRSHEASQTFLRDLDKKLWSAADRLRTNLDASVYSRAERDSLPQAARRVNAEAPSNHALHGMIFLRCISDLLPVCQREIEAQLGDPQSNCLLDPAHYGAEATDEYAVTTLADLEEA